MPSAQQTFPSSPRRRGAGAIGVAAALLLVVVLTGILHARVAWTGDPPPRTPLTVAGVSYQQQETYLRPVSYLGLVVAGRKARLGFELPGQIAEPPLREGAPVKAGEVIASLDDAALQTRRRATVADLEQARAQLDLARLKAARQRELRASGAVSKEAFDETRLQARALSAQVEAVSAKLAGIDVDLQKSRLVAPYDGVIADRYVHQGAIIAPGTPVVRLIETDHQEAHIGVAVERARSLVPGQGYQLRHRNLLHRARLIAVRPDVDPVTRSATAVFAIPADLDALDGEPVTLELEESVALQGGWLPISALLEGERGVWTVLRLEPAGEGYAAVREAVEVLDARGEQAYVRGTLPGGALVIANGIHRISPGSRVALGAE